ncbi:hypothetical protein KIN20_030185 [Parelaphostrongylus tenuis]|uniref:Uncharacterized protein n=1 Tax=Parelaphostrongylus tenuis TaxID=148309 RepID=A0AAD5WGL7_PARTN|nr:hypothetical protein KIN20_030185 [Parelaphostrongylus tenuis]
MGISGSDMATVERRENAVARSSQQTKWNRLDDCSNDIHNKNDIRSRSQSAKKAIRKKSPVASVDNGCEEANRMEE